MSEKIKQDFIVRLESVEPYHGVVIDTLTNESFEFHNAGQQIDIITKRSILKKEINYQKIIDKIVQALPKLSRGVLTAEKEIVFYDLSNKIYDRIQVDSNGNVYSSVRNKNYSSIIDYISDVQ
ncbi:MAG TPA: hypothetical protein PLD27_03145 [bacterium]|nr:hypothetical protein [bacterium]HOL47330.1 hypothetical protein [bacterium]HPQ17964.1 hypothetical protein [bacterium]